MIAAIQGVYCGDQLSGYLVQELNLSFFEELRVSASLFNNGTIYLLDGKGRMIAAGDTQESRDHFILPEAEQNDFRRVWANRDKNSREGLLFYKARGERYMSCYAKLGRTDWVMLSSVNMDQVLQIRKGYRDLILLIACVLAVLLAAVNCLFSRSLVGPIDRMIDQFRRIKERQDYTIRMDNAGKNEIGVIAGEVNSLLASIECYIGREKEKQAALAEKARRDALTGMYNKETFRQYLREALEQEERVAFLFLDVDDFKNFNTQYGHMGGDRVLCFIADALRDFADEMAGREGGDEFVAFLRNVPGKDTLDEMLRRLLAQLNQGVPMGDGGAPVPIPCSIGAALPAEGTGCSEIVALADQAMYEVKRRGKNHYCIFSAEDAQRMRGAAETAG